jgi:hypothetical protein
VSCTSAAACISVGQWSADEHGIPSFVLAEQWSGSEWQIQPAPEPTEAQLSSLAAVDCGTAFCFAVGNYWNGSITQTLVESLSAGP